MNLSNKKYNTIAVYSIVIIVVSFLSVIGLSNISGIANIFNAAKKTLEPFTIAIILAYLLNFILVYIEKILKKQKFVASLNPRLLRGLGMFITYLIAIVICAVFLRFVLPQLTKSIAGLINTIPAQIELFLIRMNDFLKNVDLSAAQLTFMNLKIQELAAFVLDFVAGIIPATGHFIMNIASSVFNIFLGIIISMYILSEKERYPAIAKKLCYAFFQEKHVTTLIAFGRRSNYIFSRFLSGKILDSVIVGGITFVLCLLLKIPYALLISVIIGVTNIIPFFGPFVGAIPCVLILLFISLDKAVIFTLLIFLIQQLDGNVIGPYILEDSMGISAFWIMFAILVFGELLGFTGMVIGVPLFAIIYTIIKDVTEYRLSRKNMETETEKYILDE